MNDNDDNNNNKETNMKSKYDNTERVHRKRHIYTNIYECNVWADTFALYRIQTIAIGSEKYKNKIL